MNEFDIMRHAFPSLSSMYYSAGAMKSYYLTVSQTVFTDFV